MAVLGIENIIGFDFIEGPSPETVSSALENLVILKALDGNTGKVTLNGKMMAQFPLDPKISLSVLKSYEFHCEDDLISIVSVLSAG